MKKRYILLLRHGAVDRSSDKPDNEQPLKEEGKKNIKIVANKLVEYLIHLPKNEQIRIGEIWHGSYTHTEETATIIRDALKKHKLGPKVFNKCEALDPINFNPLREEDDRQKVGQWLLDSTMEKECLGENSLETDTTNSNAILVVGHAPQIGWISDAILHDPFPVARSELACITIQQTDGRSGNIRWLKRIKPDRWVSWTIWHLEDEEVKKHEEDLYKKIDSKMKLAGILGSLITAILVFLLKSILDKDFSGLDTVPQVGIFISAVFFFISLGLYLSTMYAYDRLMMPVRFWAEGTKRMARNWLVERPPSSSIWVIYQNMVRIWNWLFTPATWSVIAGLLLLAYAVFQPDLIIVVGIILPLLIIFAWYYLYNRPVLGTDD